MSSSFNSISFFGFMMNPFQDRNGNDSIDEFIDNTEEGQLNNFQYYEKK